METCYRDYEKTAVFSLYDEEVFSKWGEFCFDRLYRSHLPQNREAAILEIGCGYGRYIKKLLQSGYKKVEGIDISQGQIEYAKDRLGLKDYVSMIDALDFLRRAESCAYDTILALDVLEHLSTDYSIYLLQEVHRVLKPGGKLITQVPNALAPLSPLRDADLTHYRAYTTLSMSQALLLGGFKQIHHFSVPPLVHGFKSLVRRILWQSIIYPSIVFYFLVSCGNRMGGIYTPNLISVAVKV